jgi:hypothetical protein
MRIALHALGETRFVKIGKQERIYAFKERCTSGRGYRRFHVQPHHIRRWINVPPFDHDVHHCGF